MRLNWGILFSLAATALPAQTVDYARDVHPVFVARCLSCHNGAKGQAGLSLAARADILRGGSAGPALVPGDSAASLLVQRINGSKGARMPLGGEPLKAAEVDIVRKWIDEGARMDISPTPAQRFSLALQPPKEGGINRLLAAYYRKHRVKPAPAVSDSVFARRVYLDLWGLLPTPEQQAQFARDKRPAKRALLIDSLLANRRNYSEHWISFWNDLLHNDEGVVYQGERSSITTWLSKALQENKPYNAFVAELLAPAPKDGPSGFVQGVSWRGTVNASQTPAMQAAQNSAQVFLGINLKCNSCHDSFISHWKLRESYALASFFTNEPLEIVRCDMTTGKFAEPTFLFPELGGIDAKAKLEEKRAAAARMFTAPANGLFARTIANRVWRLLFGRGLVEPLDEMEGPAWHPDLLDWLAADFIEHGYDIQHLLRTIMTSEAYQRPSVKAGGSRDAKFVFTGPWPRRLTAEQFADSIALLTGEWRVRVDNRPVPGSYAREWRFKANPLTRALGRPVRDGAVTERQTESTMLQALELTNGRVVNEWLSDGAKRMVGKMDPAPTSLFDSGVMRGAARVNVDLDITGRKQLRLLIADSGSYDPTRVKVTWTDAELSGPAGTKKLPPDATLDREILIDIAGQGYSKFRATVALDPASNQSDIGPGVRAFVFEDPPNLRKLVPVNGETPAPRLTPARTPQALVRQIYAAALSRTPAPKEMKTALALVSPRGNIEREGLQDLLWAILLSPEFQFIR